MAGTNRIYSYSLGDSSVAAHFTMAFKAALLAEYTEELDCPGGALMEESMVITPPFVN
ncbi:MAG: hypothetical protein QM802_20255 [Agriterribacter sp.]